MAVIDIDVSKDQETWWRKPQVLKVRVKDEILASRMSLHVWDPGNAQQNKSPQMRIVRSVLSDEKNTITTLGKVTIEESDEGETLEVK